MGYKKAKKTNRRDRQKQKPKGSSLTVHQCIDGKARPMEYSQEHRRWYCRLKANEIDGYMQVQRHLFPSEEAFNQHVAKLKLAGEAIIFVSPVEGQAEQFTNRYRREKDKRVYAGMPHYDPLDPETPMSVLILRKLKYFPIASIIWGKDVTKAGLVENDSRQYEFCLDTGRFDDWGICFLYVKGKQNHFKSEILKTLPLAHEGNSQRIPLIYPILSQMTDQELYTIWRDLD